MQSPHIIRLMKLVTRKGVGGSDQAQRPFRRLPIRYTNVLDFNQKTIHISHLKQCVKALLPKL